uniref:Uncharacterized protein n=1 Tax=Timema cristinae TaxID=61476 RepID=A0A7R9H2T2_TIMCR|nr:unnamed protein product [Timema cristinae]
MSSTLFQEFDHPHILLQNKDGHFSKMVANTGQAMTEELTKIAEKHPVVPPTTEPRNGPQDDPVWYLQHPVVPPTTGPRNGPQDDPVWYPQHPVVPPTTEPRNGGRITVVSFYKTRSTR